MGSMGLSVIVAVPHIHSFCPQSKGLCFTKTKSKKCHFRLSADNFEMRTVRTVEEVEKIEDIPKGRDKKIFIVDIGKRENLHFKENLKANESFVQQMLTDSANWASTNVGAKPVHMFEKFYSALSTNTEVLISGSRVLVECAKNEWPLLVLSLVYAGLCFKEPLAKIIIPRLNLRLWSEVLAKLMICKGFYIYKWFLYASVLFLCTSKKIPSFGSHVRGYLAFEILVGTKNLLITICKAIAEALGLPTFEAVAVIPAMIVGGCLPTSFDPRNVASNFPANGLNSKSMSYDPRILPSKFQAIGWNSKPMSFDPRIEATNLPDIGLNSKVGMSFYQRNPASIFLVIIGILALMFAGRIVWVALVGKQEVDKDDPGSSSSSTP